MDRAAELSVEHVVDELVLLDAREPGEGVGAHEGAEKCTSSAVSISARAPGMAASIRFLTSAALGI